MPSIPCTDYTPCELCLSQISLEELHSFGTWDIDLPKLGNPKINKVIENSKRKGKYLSHLVPSYGYDYRSHRMVENECCGGVKCL